MKIHNIIKWLSVIITIIAALTISLRVTDIIISYYIFLVGHLIMTYVLSASLLLVG